MFLQDSSTDMDDLANRLKETEREMDKLKEAHQVELGLTIHVNFLADRIRLIIWSYQVFLIERILMRNRKNVLSSNEQD